MFGLSTIEIVIILAIALIFIGPEELPKVAKQIGKHMRQVRGAMDKVDVEVRKAVREATTPTEDDEDDDDELETDGANIVAKTPVPEPASADAKTAAAKPADPMPAPVTPAPPTTPPPPSALDTADRDWSQVGKTPIEGRVPAARPARPTSSPLANAMPANDPPEPPGPPGPALPSAAPTAEPLQAVQPERPTGSDDA